MIRYSYINKYTIICCIFAYNLTTHLHCMLRSFMNLSADLSAELSKIQLPLDFQISYYVRHNSEIRSRFSKFYSFMQSTYMNL